MKEMLTPRVRLMIGSWTVYFMGEGGYGANYQALMRRNPNLNFDPGLEPRLSSVEDSRCKYHYLLGCYTVTSEK